MDLILKKLDVLKDIQEELKAIKEKNSEVLQNQIDLRKEWQLYKENSQKEVQDLKKTVRDLETRVNNMEKEKEVEERKRRINNIIISEKADGCSVPDAKTHVTKICNSITSENVRISEAQILTHKSKSGMRIIKALVSSFEEKMKIMKNKKNLKGKTVFIDDDLTKKEAALQKEIRIKAREEKEKGNQTKVGYGKLKINGVWTKWGQEKNE